MSVERALLVVWALFVALSVGLLASTIGLALLGASNSTSTSFTSEPVPGVVLMRF